MRQLSAPLNPEVPAEDPSIGEFADVRPFDASNRLPSLPLDKVATPRKILYFSCHEILEFDDLRMFTDCGHRVFSLGAFTNKSLAKGTYRNPLPSFFDDELASAYADMGGNVHAMSVPDRFADFFDVIVINHHASWIEHNLQRFGDIPIVLRTIGQSRRQDERAYAEFGKRINVVRYSECEADIPGFARTADVIYFAKYPSDFLPWSGGDTGLTFHNAYGLRHNTCYPVVSIWEAFRAHTWSRLYGKDNEGVPNALGPALAEDMAALLSRAAFYFYVWTHPPSYTLSLMEAMMAGCPILAPSAKYITATAASLSDDDAWSPARYEVPSLLQGGSGIAYDTINEAIYAAHWISNHRGAANSMSANSRETACERFNVERIGAQWNRLFERIC